MATIKGYGLPRNECSARLVPQGEGWFVVNVGDAAWLRNDAFGARCTHACHDAPRC